MCFLVCGASPLKVVLAQPSWVVFTLGHSGINQLYYGVYAARSNHNL